ncbi:MAG: hypothetical protein JXB10_06840 [Pirellulales bacterium]|nr:hypothetical protein [Pirellulales bacterium]
MHQRHTGFWLIFIAGLFAVSGANCVNMLRPGAPPLAPKLPPEPTLAQVIDAVNGNHGRIQSFYSNQAAVSGQGFGSLRTTVAYQRQRNFRLSAGTGLTGTELDVGSNSLYFWYWIRRGEPPAMYYCRHDQFAASPARHTLPIQPDWLIEALGVTAIDPASNPQGPYRLPDGRLQVVTTRNSPDGPLRKILIIDASQGWILEQQIVNLQNVLLARSVASRYRQDPASGLWMPGVVDITCPPAQFAMRLDLGNVQINQLQSADCSLWTMPSISGSPLVDLAHLPPPPQ